MTLIIDTSLPDIIEVKLENDKGIFSKKIKAVRAQAEKLLPAIDDILKQHDYSYKDIELIKVESEGNSFTSLRIGVLTANALAYALHIPVVALNGDKAFKFVGGVSVSPKYQSEPNIGKPRPSAC